MKVNRLITYVWHKNEVNLLTMVRWMRWHCPLHTRFEIRALRAWGTKYVIARIMITFYMREYLILRNKIHLHNYRKYNTYCIYTHTFYFTYWCIGWVSLRLPNVGLVSFLKQITRKHDKPVWCFIWYGGIKYIKRQFHKKHDKWWCFIVMLSFFHKMQVIVQSLI